MTTLANLFKKSAYFFDQLVSQELGYYSTGFALGPEKLMGLSRKRAPAWRFCTTRMASCKGPIIIRMQCIIKKLLIQKLSSSSPRRRGVNRSLRYVPLFQTLLISFRVSQTLKLPLGFSLLILRVRDVTWLKFVANETPLRFEAQAWLSINFKSILSIPFSFTRNQQLRERIILNSEMADVNSNFNSAVEASLLELERQGMSRVLRNQKVKAISTPLASGQDQLALLKSTPLLPHAKMLLVLTRIFR